MHSGRPSDKARLAEEGEDDDNGDGGDDGGESRHDERIQSANILQREAPSMPTTLSSEHFETARVVSERPTFVDPIIDLAHAYIQAPLEIPVGTRVFGAYQPYRPTAAFLGVIGLLLALVYALISAIESATTQWARAILSDRVL
jgi:hypothetical protein